MSVGARKARYFSNWESTKKHGKERISKVPPRETLLPSTRCPEHSFQGFGGGLVAEGDSNPIALRRIESNEAAPTAVTLTLRRLARSMSRLIQCANY